MVLYALAAVFILIQGGAGFRLDQYVHSSACYTGNCRPAFTEEKYAQRRDGKQLFVNFFSPFTPIQFPQTLFVQARDLAALQIPQDLFRSFPVSLSQFQPQRGQGSAQTQTQSQGLSSSGIAAQTQTQSQGLSSSGTVAQTQAQSQGLSSSGTAAQTQAQSQGLSSSGTEAQTQAQSQAQGSNVVQAQSRPSVVQAQGQSSDSQTQAASMASPPPPLRWEENLVRCLSEGGCRSGETESDEEPLGQVLMFNDGQSCSRTQWNNGADSGWINTCTVCRDGVCTTTETTSEDALEREERSNPAQPDPSGEENSASQSLENSLVEGGSKIGHDCNCQCTPKK